MIEYTRDLITQLEQRVQTLEAETILLKAQLKEILLLLGASDGK